jgi:hypothetical protein
MDLTATRQTWEVKSFSRECLYIVRQNRAGEWSCSWCIRESCPRIWTFNVAKHILT